MALAVGRGGKVFRNPGRGDGSALRREVNGPGRVMHDRPTIDRHPSVTPTGVPITLAFLHPLACARGYFPSPLPRLVVVPISGSVLFEFGSGLFDALNVFVDAVVPGGEVGDGFDRRCG